MWGSGISLSEPEECMGDTLELPVILYVMTFMSVTSPKCCRDENVDDKQSGSAYNPQAVYDGHGDSTDSYQGVDDVYADSTDSLQGVDGCHADSTQSHQSLAI